MCQRGASGVGLVRLRAWAHANFERKCAVRDARRVEERVEQTDENATTVIAIAAFAVQAAKAALLATNRGRAGAASQHGWHNRRDQQQRRPGLEVHQGPLTERQSWRGVLPR